MSGERYRLIWASSSCPVTENFFQIEPLLRGHLSYKATFSMFQRWPFNTGLTVQTLIIFRCCAILRHGIIMKYRAAQTENAKSVSYQGLSQRGINEKSVYIQCTWTICKTTWTWRTEHDVFTRPSRIVNIEMFIHNEYYTWLYLQSFIL